MLSVSAKTLPEINRIGVFPLINPVFDFVYRSENHALHLYGYEGTIRIEGREYPFKSGDLTCICKGLSYSISSQRPGTHWCVHFEDPQADDTNPIQIPEHITLGGRSLIFREELQHISRLWMRSCSGSLREALQAEARHRLKALLLALYSLNASPKALQQISTDCAWDDFLQWIDGNLHKALTLHVLARRLNISPNGFSRKFKMLQEVSVSDYLLARRIARAKVLLSSTALTVGEVGTAVGIPDPQYFNKRFRRVTGLSPSDYRRRNATYMRDIAGEIAVREGGWGGTE